VPWVTIGLVSSLHQLNRHMEFIGPVLFAEFLGLVSANS
jgi:hypothetical protein